MIDGATLRELFQLGGTVVTCGMFLWYLARRDAAMEHAVRELSSAINQLRGSDQK